MSLLPSGAQYASAFWPPNVSCFMFAKWLCPEAAEQAKDTKMSRWFRNLSIVYWKHMRTAAAELVLALSIWWVASAQEYARIRGHVLDENNAPVANADITVHR